MEIIYRFRKNEFQPDPPLKPGGIYNINLIVLSIMLIRPTYWKTFFFLTTLTFYSNCLYFFTTTYIKYKQTTIKGYNEDL